MSTDEGGTAVGEPAPGDLRRSPLDAWHRAAGARMTPFGGWEMPLAYPSGTLAEHRACRRDAAVFDVSHLGTVRVEGPDAFGRLQATFTNDLRKIAPGRAQYTHLLAADGSVLDDIIVWWVEPERFDVMPNASNTARVRAAVGGDDVTASRAVIAVQGPAARRRAREVLGELADVGRFRVVTGTLAGVPVVVAGTGYTGEDGIEVAVPAPDAPALWEALVAAGCTPAGLGARDTLRLEAGLPLHGHELGPGVTPLQAGLGWVISWDKGPFPGREALEAERTRGPARRLRGLRGSDRRPPREGAEVRDGDGNPVGTVTSGNFSPMLEVGIGLALIDEAAGIADGDPVVVRVRDRDLPMEVVRPPFVRPGQFAA